MVFFHAEEVKRKSFHLLALVYILAYWLLPKNIVLSGMLTVTILVIIGESVRLRVPDFNRWILDTLGGVHREEEFNKVSGLPWTLLGSFLTMLIFQDKKIVLVSMSYLVFGDAIAALIGRQLGRVKILRDKTLEGSIACFSVCFLLGLFLFNWHTALIGALIATFLEAIPWPLNDNFWMPLVSSAALTMIVPFFR